MKCALRCNVMHPECPKMSNSQGNIAIIGVAMLFAVNSAYIFLRQRRLARQGIPQRATDWMRIAFLILVGLAAWIAFVMRFIRP